MAVCLGISIRSSVRICYCFVEIQVSHFIFTTTFSSITNMMECMVSYRLPPCSMNSTPKLQNYLRVHFGSRPSDNTSYRAPSCAMNSTSSLKKQFLVHLTPESINFDVDLTLFFNFSSTYQLELSSFFN